MSAQTGLGAACAVLAIATAVLLMGLLCLCLTLAGVVLAGMAWENNDHDD